MAGIKEAMTRVMERRNEGTVVAQGKLHKECGCGTSEGCSDCDDYPYVIIKLTPDSKASKVAGHAGYITVYDRNSDVRIHPDVGLADKVMLVILDNWTAAWVKKDSDFTLRGTPKWALNQ